MISKLEIIEYKKLNAEGSKIPRNSRGNFSKDILPGIPGGLAFEEQAILQEPSTNVVHTAGNRMQCRVQGPAAAPAIAGGPQTL